MFCFSIRLLEMFRHHGMFCFSIRLLEMFRQRGVFCFSIRLLEKSQKEMKNKTDHAVGTFLII
jgi:hypothetical protein